MAARCWGVRLSSGSRSPRSAASGSSLPLSAPGQAYSPEESARRKRPVVARRYSESWCSRTVITEPAWVRTGCENRRASTTFGFSLYVASAQPVFGSPSKAASGGCSGAGLLRLEAPALNVSRRPSTSASTSVITTRSAPRATRMPGRLSSCTSSTPSCGPRARAGLELHGVGFVVGIGSARDYQAVAGRAVGGQVGPVVVCVIHRLIVVDLEDRAVFGGCREGVLRVPGELARLDSARAGCFSQAARAGARLSILASSRCFASLISPSSSSWRCFCSGGGNRELRPPGLGSPVGHQAGLFDVGEERLHRVEIALT